MAPRRIAPELDRDVAQVMAFVNTLSGRGSTAPRESLTSYGALVDWAKTAGVITGPAAARLRQEAEGRPHEAGRMLERARDLRETLHELFSALSEEQLPAPRVLSALAAHFGASFAKARLVLQDGTLQWAPGSVASLEDVAGEIARAAARLVGSHHLARVRACAADDCRWWFVDDTRNHSRRWCEMKTCGNRAKVRRFRARRT